jgi:hypothetical protein
VRRLAPFLALALLVPAAPGDAAKRPKPKRCEVVVFQRHGRTVRRCRLQRKATPAPKVTPLPSLAAPATPPPAVVPPAAPAPPAPAPVAAGPIVDEPRAEPQRDPWFLTVHARDVGNGDFRLLPAIGDIPAGTLYLSYLNEDRTPHDLWLSGTQLFEPYVGDELRRTKLELRPGTYELLCRMPGHDQMRRTFSVTT